jgi:hypothetical protein
MRLLRVRLTVKRIMRAVLVFGVVLHLGLSAYRVHGNGSHFHHYLRVNAGISENWVITVSHPFLNRYVLCLAGRPWVGPGICTSRWGLQETCSMQDEAPRDLLDTARRWTSTWLYHETSELSAT